MLGIRQVTSAARTARSNGEAEALVKRLSEHLKFYVKDDYTIEEVIPIIEVNLRATPHSKLLILPYEIVFGRPMRIGVPGDPSTAQTVISADGQSANPSLGQIDPDSTRRDSGDTNLTRDQPIMTQTDPTGYYKWLSTKLWRVHDAVKIAREEVKKDDKVRYNKAHKVIEPTWKIGDTVLLQESTIKPGVSKVITKQHFDGPYIIQDIVVGHPNVGPTYRLVDEKTGKPLCNLVSNNRLKI